MGVPGRRCAFFRVRGADAVGVVGAYSRTGSSVVNLSIPMAFKLCVPLGELCVSQSCLCAFDAAQRL